MTRPTPFSGAIAPLSRPQRELLDALSAEYLHNYSKGRTLLAVDGIGNAGTRAFADGLAERMARDSHVTFRASLDRFLLPRAERELRGVDSAHGAYRNSHDIDLFRRVLVEPFRLGGSAGFVVDAFDAERDRAVDMEWETGPADATLIVDGGFPQSDRLRGLWSATVWLDAAGDASAAQSAYLVDAAPRSRATMLVDNTDQQQPRRVFADSC